MSDKVTFNIPIPTDPDGFVILQCSLCSEFFKMTPSNFKDESQIQVWCPHCGLIPDSLFTDDLKSLAMKLAQNHVSDLMNDFSRNLSKSFKTGNVKFKAGTKMKKEATDPLISKLDNLETQTYLCCDKEAKISPSLKIEGGYCPFCGEMQNGN